MRFGLRLLGPILVVVLLLIVGILGIVRPRVILGWAKQAHPEIRVDDETPLLAIVRLIGAGGLIMAAYVAILVARAIWILTK
jgi:hypothetical protein